MPPLCKIPTRFPVESRPLEDGRNRWWKGIDGRGPSSHQLRLEINRRQMRRGAYGATFPPLSLLADFSHPPPTIRLFSTNTKRYTRPFPPPSILYIYIYPLVPSSNSSRLFGFLRFLNAFQIDQNEFLSRLEYTQVRIN